MAWICSTRASASPSSRYTSGRIRFRVLGLPSAASLARCQYSRSLVNWSQAMQPHCSSGICSAGRRMCAGAKQVVVFMVDSSLSRIIKDNYCITQPETRSVSKRSAACTVRFSTPASVAAVSSTCRASASMAASEVTSRFCTPRVRAGTSSATLLFLH